MTILKRARWRLVTITLILGLVLASLPVWFAHRSTLTLAATADSVPLFENLGDHHYPVSTQSRQAQQYFDQGLTLAYGFNHAEAARSFQTAAALDDTCAMCYWGIAYVLGPNINIPMEETAVPSAWEALQQAIARSSHATIKERLLIQALADRYSPEATEDRTDLDEAYATALKQLHQRYPDDLEVATFYAEALMDTMPWDYWDEAGQAKPRTVELLNTLESVMAQDPHHVGALHLYIHAVEKEHPELAEKAADNLRGLVPAAGHLVHMPSHIYVRIGRYHDAVMVNQDAVEADNAYLQGPHLSGPYTTVYMPHNHHFEWFGALMTGQQDIALKAAEGTSNVDPELIRAPGFAGALQHYSSVPLYTLVRFERWQDILSTSAPETDLKYPTGVWHYARGMALTAQGQIADAQAELAAVQTLVADPDLTELSIWGFNNTAHVLGISAKVLAGEIALAQQNYESAIAHLQSATELEDQLIYTEPPDWYSPTRNLLGQAFLQAKRYGEAEQAFRADLAIYPDNGWSLYGLMQSLKVQGQNQEAAIVQRQFEAAWQYADQDLLSPGLT